MRSLVVYYSLEGNTRYIAEAIKEAVGADSFELKPEVEINPKGFMKYMEGGRQVVKKETPNLKNLDLNPDDYDVLFIGTPVWAFSYTPALRTLFAQCPIKAKKIALFCCQGGQPGKTFGNIKNAIPDNTFLGEIDFKEPLKNNKEESRQKAIDWAKKIIEHI